MSRTRSYPLTPKQVDILSRAATTPSDEGLIVEHSDAISAQSLRRRGWVKLVNRSMEHAAGYRAFITDTGREELARLAQ